MRKQRLNHVESIAFLKKQTKYKIISMPYICQHFRSYGNKKWSSKIIFNVLPIRFQLFCVPIVFMLIFGRHSGRGEEKRRKEVGIHIQLRWINKAVAGGAWPALIARIKRIAFTNDAFRIGWTVLFSLSPWDIYTTNDRFR